jgi:hypothetical protein
VFVAGIAWQGPPAVWFTPPSTADFEPLAVSLQPPATIDRKPLATLT